MFLVLFNWTKYSWFYCSYPLKDAFRLKYFGDFFLSEVGFPLLCGSYMSLPRDKPACQTSPCKCKICISSIESAVYNKKKIQFFVVNMTFISSSEVKKCIFHSCLRHSWNIHFFHFTRWNKSHIHSKHLNIFYMLLSFLQRGKYLYISTLKTPGQMLSCLLTLPQLPNIYLENKCTKWIQLFKNG